MASACPNIRSEQWLETVEKVGYFEAYRIFVANGFEMAPFAFKTISDVNKYLNSIKQLNKRGDVWMIPYGKDYGTYTTNTSLVSNEVKRINNTYKGLLTIKSKPVTKPDPRTPSRTKIEWVETNEQALVEHYKVYEDPIQARKDIEDEGLIPDYEQRVQRLSPENHIDFEKKRDIMRKTFPRVKSIVEDYTISQSGFLSNDRTVIMVNPKLWTTDTIGHEFGHLLIDTIGGMSNPLIKKARKQLLGSDIEASVKERYPDLVEEQDDRIDKEIVAQAIGEQTAKIFSEEKDRAEWKNILIRILERIKKFLHIDHNASKELARMVLSGESINSDTVLEGSIYEQRPTSVEELKKKLNKTTKGLTTIEAIREKSIAALEKKYGIYRKRDFTNKLETLTKALTKIKELDNDTIESLRLFQNFAVEQTQAVYDRYAVAKRDADKFTRGEEGGKPFTLRDLATWRDYVSGFALLSELAELAEAVEIDASKKETGIEKVLNKKLLSEAIRQRDTIEKAYVDNGKELVSEFLAGHSKHIEAEFRDSIEREYNQLTKEQKSLKPKEKYIEERLGVEAEDIDRLTRKKIREELDKASKDINMAQRWIDNVLDSPDTVVSAMAAAFVEADRKARLEILSVQDQMLEKVKALEAFQKDKVGITKDIKGSYDFMLEKDKDGNYTQNIITPYKSSIWDNYNEFKDSLEKEGISYDQIQERLKWWKNKNMPLNYKKFNEVKEVFLEGLIKDGIITNKEKEAINENSHWDREKIKKGIRRKDLSEIVNPEAANKIHEWLHENVNQYREPVDYRNKQWVGLVNMAGGNSKMDIPEQIKTVNANKTKDPRIDFYNFIQEQNKKIQTGIPYSHRLHARLPSVLKDTSERAKAGQSAAKLLKHTVSSNLSVLADEDERGERIITDEAGKPVHFIPIYYTTNLHKYYAEEYDRKPTKGITKEEYATQKTEENQSYDLASIFSRYYSSAINYKHKFEILPEMEMARFLVSERSTEDLDGKGNVIKDFFGKEKKVKTENLANQLNDWFEAVMYGIKEKKEGSISLFGGEIDIAKAADALNKYTALNLLGLNFVQGTANAILGSTMQTIEAFGGKYFSKKDLARANVIYGKNLPAMLWDVGRRKSENRISLLLRDFDILNEYQQNEFRKNTKFRQALSTNTLFFTSHAGEHFMQTKVLIAMLNKLQAVDSEGNVLGPMIDQYSVANGNLTLNDKVDNFSEKQQSLFEAKVRRVLSSMHGEYTQAGRVAIQRYALGRMAYMFRKFVVPGIRRRYGKRKVNNLLGEYVEGSYRTTNRFFIQMFKDMKNLQFTMMASDWHSMTDMEKSNVRKTLVEFTFLMTATILSSVLLNMKEDADDGEEWIWAFLGYQALRYKTELWFFINPMESMTILRSPAASMSVIENTIRLFGQLMPPDFEGFERYERGSWKGRPKIQKTATNFVPGLKQLYRLKNIDDQISWLQ